MPQYIAIIHKDADSDFGVTFPDLPRCVSAGANLDEAQSMAAKALALHLEGMVAEGETIPPPSPLIRIMADPDNRDGVAIIVSAPSWPGRAVRVNITLPEDVLRDIDAYAESNGFTRSGFVAKAARKALTS